MMESILAQLADIAVTLFCVTSLAFWGWWFFGKLLSSTPRGLHIVLYGQGDGDHLEQSIRRLIWLRAMGLLTCPILISDQGLSPQGREIAQRLCERWAGVTLES